MSVHRIGVLAFAPLAIFTTTACGPAYRFAATTGRTFPPKPQDCVIEVTNGWPYGAYEEIGVVEPTGSPTARTYSNFWYAVRPEVCAKGGDVVVAQINGFGYYVRGIVLRRSSANAPPYAGNPEPRSDPSPHELQ